MVSAKVDGHVVMRCYFGTGKEAAQEAKGYKTAPVRKAGGIVDGNLLGKGALKKAIPITEVKIDMISGEVDMAKQVKEGALDATYA